MTEATRQKLPAHLLRYVVEQDYARYTAEDQAVWRFIMRQLKNFLSTRAHPSYLQGLIRSGIEVDRIPRIDVVDEHLEKFGWGAVPVSGFIPPAAFMEFQSLGVLPIASDMRTMDHLLYTPAPDIVHEAAGHAPILADPDYAAYLRQYGEVARHSIISQQDLEQYEAIRILSDLKEDPRSTTSDIERAEKALLQINQNIQTVSEAALLSRMNWWTAEYGLVGSPDQPKIFGAGLLSSLSESRDCLDPKIHKIPLSVDCVNFSYDITEPQPQLFVARDFSHLGLVLEDLSERLAYRRGGIFGLDRAVEAETVNSVQFNSGIQISGILKAYIVAPDSSGQVAVAYLQFSGPCQLAVAYHELAGQGTARHALGFSCPLGRLKNHRRCLSTYAASDLANMGLKKGDLARLEFESGVLVEGRLKDFHFAGDKLILLTWQDCRVTLGEKILFAPDWGEYDMAVGSQVTSVFGGPADRSHFGQTEDFVTRLVPPRKLNAEERARHDFFARVRALRESGNNAEIESEFTSLLTNYLSRPQASWLEGVELLELTYCFSMDEANRAPILARLRPEAFPTPTERRCVQEGLELARVSL